MVTISESNRPAVRQYGNSQFRYALVYVALTLVVLLFLNIYCSRTSQKLFYQSKESAMVEKCLLTASEIANLEVINREAVAEVISQMDSPSTTRLLVTDQYGLAIFDSWNNGAAEGHYVLLPEVVVAMEKKDVFSWKYHDGTMKSCAATPIIAYRTLVGCVYMMEYDTEQGTLIQSLQNNVLSITLVLELLVILCSLIFSRVFSERIRRILTSIRIIREGDYTHQVEMSGRDELKFVADEFNELSEKLQQSEQKRRQFVSDASHELKTPLASIKLLSDSILQNDVDMQTVREFVGDIGSEADRLNRMSQKLLSLNRVESQQDGECEIVWIAPTVERVTRMLGRIARESQITIHTKLSNDSQILILEDDLYQIIFNLMENGIKYNTPGGSLTVILSREEDNAVIRFADNGVGIPKQALGQIFERFYRVDKARSRKSGGSGLGLSIVKSMVQRNQGTISVESELGKGSVFTVTFPVFDMEEGTE